MVAIDTDTTPTTLAGIAAALDEHREALADMRAERDEHLARLDAEIAERQAAARDLIARQAEMMQATFGDLMPSTAPARARRRGAAPAAAVRPNIAARQRNAAIRRFAAEKGLECPETGSDFSPELLAAFDQDGGYQS